MTKEHVGCLYANADDDVLIVVLQTIKALLLALTGGGVKEAGLNIISSH